MTEDPVNPLVEAAQTGDCSTILQLLDRGVNVDGDCAGKPTPLQLAVRNGHDDAAKLLISRHASLSTVRHYGDTNLLYVACRAGMNWLVEHLLDAGFNINATSNNSDETPLWAAAEGLQTDTVAFLLKRGAKYRMLNSCGESLLFARTDRKTMSLLLSLGLNVNHKSRIHQETPLHKAALNLAPDQINLLIEHGASIAERDRSGMTPLHCACQRYPEDKEAVRCLLNAGADPNALSLYNGGPLHFAARSNAPETIKLLVAAGALVNKIIPYAENPFMYINEQSTELEIISAVAGEKGRKRSLEFSPLQIAMRWGNEEAIKSLLELDANPNLQDRFGKTAYDWAKNKTILDLLPLRPDIQQAVDLHGDDAERIVADAEVLGFFKFVTENSLAKVMQESKINFCRYQELRGDYPASASYSSDYRHYRIRAPLLTEGLIGFVLKNMKRALKHEGVNVKSLDYRQKDNESWLEIDGQWVVVFKNLTGEAAAQEAYRRLIEIGNDLLRQAGSAERLWPVAGSSGGDREVVLLPEPLYDFLQRIKPRAPEQKSNLRLVTWIAEAFDRFRKN